MNVNRFIQCPNCGRLIPEVRDEGWEGWYFCSLCQVKWNTNEVEQE